MSRDDETQHSDPPNDRKKAQSPQEGTRLVTDSQSGDDATTDHSGIAPGIKIGHYTLLRQIGEGGMGAVWLAEQKSPVRRDVALKIIKAGMDTHEVIARFEAERQALALMSHPNIAKVLDAGATETGRPFFVMELVNGEPITAYCDRKKLSPDERINLFKDVCHAVQHAHQRGIIHRDIKPSNVLVSEDQDNPLIKVIDFGLAKAVSQKLTEKTLFTAAGQVVGTPAYMSPEQIERGGLDVDTRTDVYSLGVLLYELLTGATPLDIQQLKGAGYAEMLRMIREQEPPRMSHRLGSLGADSETTANNRATDVKRLSRRFRGDLDVIVMNALAKEPNRRYSTPNDFADDLQRFLNREPIEARPASAYYRFKKLAERNKGKFVAAGLLMVAVIAGFIGTALGLIEAKRQTGIAEENFQLARESVDRYFTNVSENRLLNEPYMDDLRHELLTSAREFYQTFVERRQNDPTAITDLAEAQINLGGISAKMGDRERAETEFKAAKASAQLITDSENGESENLQLQCDTSLCEFLISRGEHDAALEQLKTAIAMAQSAADSYPDQHTFKHKCAILTSIRGNAYRALDQQELAEKEYQTSINALEQLTLNAPEETTYPRDLAITNDRLGNMLLNQERMDDAEECFTEAVSIWRDKIDKGDDSVDTRGGLADSLISLATCFRRNEKLKQAVPLGEESARIGRAISEQHPGLVSVQESLIGHLGNLAVIYTVDKQQEKADSLNAEALSMLESFCARFPDEAFHFLRLGAVEGNRAYAIFNAGRYEESIRWYDRANQTLKVVLNKSSDPRARKITRNNHWGRADAFVKLDRFDEAIEAFNAAIEMANPGAIPQIKLDRARALIRSGDYEAAVKSVEVITPSINLDLLGRKSNVALIWFKSGEVLIDAAQATADDPDRDADEKTTRVKQLRLLAIEKLNKAHKFGYFDKIKSQAVLRSDPFGALAEFEEFKTLLQDVDSIAADKTD